MMGKKEVGGLFGEIPTSEIPAARRAYLDYVENFSGNDSERLDFADFVRQKWKKRFERQKTEE